MTRVADVSPLFVAEKRAINASWATIARMAGVSEPALRRRFDRSYQALALAPVDPREAVQAGLVKAGFSEIETVVLTRLWQANGGHITEADLTRGVRGPTQAIVVAREVRDAAKARGIDFAGVRTHGWALTSGGKVRIEVLAGLRTADGRAVTA